jgi:RNA polymerase primary sigma factor
MHFLPVAGQSWWLDAIGRIPLLTPAEEIELGTLIQRGMRPDATPREKRAGMRARDRFVQANLRLAVSYVSKRCNRLTRIHGQDDLIQAANEGLIRAVERFDPARGYRFSTYAYWWIRQAVGCWAYRHGRSIAIPGSHCQHLGRLAAVERRLTSELNRTPTHQEIAEALGVSVAVLEQVIENGRPVGSLDQVVSDDGLELSGLVATYDRSPEEEEEQRERWRQAEQLRNLISRLPNQERRLLSLAWGLDGVELPRPELAQQEGLSTRALELKLQRLQASLASQSVQLVLVAVARKKVEPKNCTRRRRERPDQLVLVPVERVKPQPAALRSCGSIPRNWLGLRDRLRLVLEVVA